MLCLLEVHKINIARTETSKKALTICDCKFLWLAEFFDLALLIQLVWLLVVDEELLWAVARHPLIEKFLVCSFLKRLLKIAKNKIGELWHK